MHSEKIRIGQLALEPYRQLSSNGQPVLLGQKALTILSVLAEARGALVTKGELMDAVWHGLTVEENAIQVHIVSLRKALGDAAVLLATVRGLGYRLDIPDNILDAHDRHSSVAVLNFVNMTGEPKLDYLGDGISEELINILSGEPDLKVPARTSSFAYKDRHVDARQISSELGVSFLVEGSVRVSEDQMRVTAQLIDAKEGIHKWSNSSDHDLCDVLTLQTTLAKNIAKSITPLLRPEPDQEQIFWGDTLPNFR